MLTIVAEKAFTLGEEILGETWSGAQFKRCKDQADRFGLILKADGRTPMPRW